MQITKLLEREAAQISKEHSGMIAFPTIGLALLVFCLYIFVLFMFASGYLAPLISCLLYTSPSPRDRSLSRMPSSA